MKNVPAEAGLRIEVFADYEGVSRRAAELIRTELKRRPDLLLCASAGATPTRTYELLGGYAMKQPQLFKKLRVLQIDEWGGLPPRCPASCAEDLRRKLLEPLRVDSKRCSGFRSAVSEPEKECDRIARWLARNGPIDISILGLGTNGHIAMNEPGSTFNLRPHVARLAPSSRHHPMLQNSPQKPRYGLTLGIGDILRSRKVLLLVNGSHKRAALQQLLAPRVTTRFPASCLWLHPDATVLCDRTAAPANMGLARGRASRLHTNLKNSDLPL